MTDRISDRQIEALHAIAEAGQAIAAALRETPQPEEAQIAASAPAERPRADSAGREASGGVSAASEGGIDLNFPKESADA